MQFDRFRVTILLAGFVTAFCGMSGSDASAQPRTRRPVRVFQPNRRVNARHERLKEQAVQAQSRGNYKQVLALTNQVLRENPRDIVSYYLRASARAQIAVRSRDAKLLRLAVADARQAISLDRAKTSMYYMPYLFAMTNLTGLEGRKDHAETAVKVAGQVLRVAGLRSDEKANLFYQRGFANMALRKFATAGADYQAAIKLSRVHLAAHLGAANAFNSAGQPDKARAQYNLAVRTFPNNPRVYNLRGVFHQQQGKYDEAIADFTRAISLNRRFALGYVNRGFCLLEQGNPKSAEADFTTSLRLDGQQPVAYQMRARARMAQGNMAGSVADNRMEVRLSPNSGEAHSHLAFGLFFAEQYPEALKSFDQSVKLDPRMVQLSPWRFLLMELTGKTKAAKKIFAKEIAKAEKDRNWGESVIAFLAGKIDAKTLIAAVDQKDAAKTKAQLCEAHFFVGRKQQSAGKTAEALDHYKKSLATKQRQLSAYNGALLASKKLSRVKPKTGR